MSDNVTNLNEKQKKCPVRRIILFAVLVLGVCLGVAAYVFRDSLNLDAARRFVRYLNVLGGGTDGCGRPCARLYRQLPHDITHPGGPPALCTQHTSAA